MNSAAYISKILITSTLTSALLLAGCGSDNNNSPSNQVSQSLITNTESYAPQQTTATTIVSDKITYKMPAIAGGQTTATAVVMIPKGTAPIGGWPIIVWAHGTTGVADQCAPSNLKSENGEFNLGGALPIAQALVSQGYAVIAPDYEGLGSAGIHPFLNAKSESESIISAVKAVKQQYSTQVSNDWAVVGHSQGGHAAIAAAERADDAGLNFKGVVAYAPASNLKQTFDYGQAAVKGSLQQGKYETAITILAGLQTFSALATAGVKQTMPNTSFDDVFRSRGAVIAKKAETELCSDKLGQAFGQDIQASLQTGQFEYPGLVTNFNEVPAIKTFLVDSTIGQKPIAKPIVVVQGELDSTVPADITRLLESQVRTSSKNNSNIIFKYPATDTHGTVVLDALNPNGQLATFLKTNLPSK